MTTLIEEKQEERGSHQKEFPTSRLHHGPCAFDLFCPSQVQARLSGVSVTVSTVLVSCRGDDKDPWFTSAGYVLQLLGSVESQQQVLWELHLCSDVCTHPW